MSLSPIRRHQAHSAPATATTAPSRPIGASLRASLAQDAFSACCRTYGVRNGAMVGLGVDMGIHRTFTLRDDVRNLMRSDLKPLDRVAVASKTLVDVHQLAQSAVRVRVGATMIARTVSGKPAVPGAHHPPNCPHDPNGHNHHAIPGAPPAGPVLTRITQAGAVGSVVLAAVAMPAVAKQAYRDTQAAVAAVRDPATKGRRSGALMTAAYSNAALLNTAAAIPHAISTFASVGSATATVTRLSRQFVATPGFQAVHRVTNAVSTVADGVLLVGDTANLVATFRNDSATRGEKARSVFNVAIGATKMVGHFAPTSRPVQVAYTVAGVLQLGLAGYDLVKGHRHANHGDHGQSQATGHDHHAGHSPVPAAPKAGAHDHHAGHSPVPAAPKASLHDHHAGHSPAPAAPKAGAHDHHAGHGAAPTADTLSAAKPGAKVPAHCH
jgi:hypothetical protein